MSGSVTLKLLGSNDFFTQEAYKVLRTNLQFCGQDIKVIAITSCSENEGKTTVSLQIGKSFAELGKRVLVIDADMRKSVMAGRDTTATDSYGLSEVLTGLKNKEECICDTQYETMKILFAGQYPPNPVELISDKYFGELIAYARENYDYVIIDTPPLGRVIDAAVIATFCDGVVLVIGNNIRYRYAQRTMEQLEKSGCKILGAIRNSVRRKSGGYYSSYYKNKGYYKYKPY
ncbi:MAG: CpsD/CapB family tyrosine-protein kinase [Clostridia bacterium]|nr:CpsD/CapB family tyrosine-protein kinase [Clostridia bacterium]